MKIGLLSTYNASFLGYYLREFLALGITPTAIIMDSKDVSEKDAKIFQERTQGRMPKISLDEYQDAHIPSYFVKNHNSEETAKLVKNLGLDLLVNGGTPRILKSVLLSAPKIGVISCHPGLLPAFKGCTCVEWAIYKDEKVGNTVHFMNEAIDEGPTVIQEAINFSKKDSYVDVRLKVYASGMSLLAKAIKKIEAEKLHPSQMPKQVGGEYFSPIDDAKLEEVKLKLAAGKYKFQLD